MACSRVFLFLFQPLLRLFSNDEEKILFYF
jgi:hypothetical protein